MRHASDPKGKIPSAVSQLPVPGWIPGDGTRSQTRLSCWNLTLGVPGPPHSQKGTKTRVGAAHGSQHHSLCPSELRLLQPPPVPGLAWPAPLQPGAVSTPSRQDRLPTQTAESCPAVPPLWHLRTANESCQGRAPGSSCSSPQPWEQPGPRAKDPSCKGCGTGASAGRVVPGFTRAPKPCLSQTLPHCSAPPYHPLQQGGQRDAGGRSRSSREPLWGRRQSRSHLC